MKPRKHTNKEINDASIATRKEAEKLYTYDKVREMHPIDITTKEETKIRLSDLRKYEYYDIERFIDDLRRDQKEGATHFQVSWSNAEWADDEPLELECIKMKSETVIEWDARIERTREKYLNDVYAKVQSEMLRHNEQLNLYLALKEQFEPTK